MLHEKNFNTGEVTLNYAEGDPTGPPLVLIHGFTDKWQTYQPIITPLSQSWHIYAPDLRGHGKSEKKPGAYRYRDHLQDLERFMDAVVAEPAVLFGHSMGGVISIMYAATHPEKTRALIIGDSPMNFKDSQFQKQISYHYLRAIYEDMSKGYETEELLPKITCPVLLLRASPKKEGLIPDADLNKAKTLIRHLHTVQYDDVGHDLHKAKPSRVLDDVTRFLESVR
ncbi:MAG TPA: alpha/beta hydrolase [Candidatus Desulfaltia sp.]|nr:alpha/beta hydrolase [Candidatus Desulfaltia sp.]